MKTFINWISMMSGIPLVVIGISMISEYGRLYSANSLILGIVAILVASFVAIGNGYILIHKSSPSVSSKADRG